MSQDCFFMNEFQLKWSYLHATKKEVQVVGNDLIHRHKCVLHIPATTRTNHAILSQIWPQSSLKWVPQLKALSKWVPDLKTLKWMGTSAQSSQMGTSAQSSQWVSELKDLSGYPPLSAQFENLFNQLDFIFSFYHKMWETIVQSLQHTTHDAFQFASAKPCILVCTLSQQKNSKEFWPRSKYKSHRFGF
jgi:hypothetical protein